MSKTIKIAIATEGDKVSSHFGHCSGFEVLHVENGSITNRSFIKSPGHKPGFLPKFLAEKKYSHDHSRWYGGGQPKIYLSKMGLPLL